MSESNVATGQEQESSVEELVRQRDQLRGWIARLDEVGGEAAGHVTERVRRDYEDRLRSVTEALSAHAEEIQHGREAARTAVAEAEIRRARAGDQLEEHRLRHVIGELANDAWEARRPELEGEVGSADQALSDARAELARLEALAAEVSASAPAPPESLPAPAPPPSPAESVGDASAVEAPAAEAAEKVDEEDEADEWEPEVETVDSMPSAGASPAAGEPVPSADDWDPFGGEFGTGDAAAPGDAADELPWLDDLARGEKGWTADTPAVEGLETEERTAEKPGARSDLGADDLAFLEELDRAISSSPAPAPAPPGPGTPAAPGATPPAETSAPGAKAEPLLCKECGAINEPHAWYCEICGSEL
jgi:hypothetical protein